MNWNPVEEKIKKTIQEHGYEYLKNNAGQIYQDLVKQLSKQKTGRQMATAVYFSFLMEIPAYAMRLPSTEELQNEIQTRCLMNENMAREMATMYHELFSEETIKSLQDSEEKGFRELCE